MDKKFLKKIIAQSQEDLQIISACCSEAKIKINDIKYLPSSKIFLIFLSRINNEETDNKRLINSIIKFEFIDSTKSKNIDQNNIDLVLELLAINVFKIVTISATSKLNYDSVCCNLKMYILLIICGQILIKLDFFHIFLFLLFL